MKVRKVFSLILNLIAVIASIVGIVFLKDSLKVLSDYVIFVKFFTLVTNLAIVIVGLVSVGYYTEALIKKKGEETVLPTWMFALRTIVGVAAMITFITVVGYLQYTALKDLTPKDTLFWNNICHHYVAPLAFTSSLLFFDLDKKYPFKSSLFGPLLLVIYMAYAIPICIINKDLWGGAPYVFMDTDQVQLWILLLFIPGFLIAGFILSFLLWLLNRICYLIFIGDEVSKEEESVEEKEVQESVEVTPEDENAVNDVIKTGYNGPRIYHISKREDKKWQVKFANGKKAIKLFDTQAEAIVFAKKLAKSQDGSIRVHSLKGRIRKAN